MEETTSRAAKEEDYIDATRNWGTYVIKTSDTPHLSQTRVHGANATGTITHTTCPACANSTGTVKKRYSYTPYGVRSIMDANWASRTASSYDWTAGHQGLVSDNESGLVYNRARYLHPQLGRLLQRDPTGYITASNLYEYER